MTVLPGRMTFQLTPLLDLLLIIVFAQFLETSERTENLEGTFAARFTELQQEHDTAIAAVDERRRAWEDAFDDFSRQLDSAGDVLSDVFDVDEELLRQAISPAESTNPERQQAVDRLRSVLQDVARRRGRDVIRQLLTYNELRNRCDVWEIHITEDGVMWFTDGIRVREFRAETPGEFAQKLFEAYKAFEQPKTLVVLMFTWGDAKAGVRQLVLDGLPEAVERMRDDRSGQNWFEFALLGFTPDGPMIRVDGDINADAQE